MGPYGRFFARAWQHASTKAGCDCCCVRPLGGTGRNGHLQPSTRTDIRLLRFPPHTYTLQYPAPGSPDVARHIRTLLQNAGIANAADEQRGLDHGVFIPFILAFPHADIPVVELSLQMALDPAEHLAIGAALAPLRAQNVLIVGTGLSYHNLRHFMNGSPVTDQPAQAFDAWLTATACAPPPERNLRLTQWAQAPGARLCHPREEHLLPLMIAAGAAGQDKGQQIYSDIVLGKALSGYRFG